jgi:hypothetical protein
MTLRPEYSLGHSEYNAFLFASVGEEKTGLQLTVQTALIRLGLDPWQEAARLSGLPKAAAVQAMTAAIARLPEGDWVAANLPEIAARLVANLPGRSAPAVPFPAARRLATKRPLLEQMKSAMAIKTPASARLVWVALVIALFVGLMALRSNDNFESPPGDGSAVQSDRSDN